MVETTIDITHGDGPSIALAYPDLDGDHSSAVVIDEENECVQVVGPDGVVWRGDPADLRRVLEQSDQPLADR